MFKGSEIKRLVLVSTLCCVLLIASVSLYLMISSRNNLREQTDKMKLAMAEEIAGHLQECYASMTRFLRSDAGIKIDVSNLMGGDPAALIDFFNGSILGTFDAEMVTYNTYDGRSVTAVKPGFAAPQLPAGAARGSGEYVILNELGGRQGTFFVFYKEGILPGDEVVYVIDNTSQVESIHQAFQDEKDRQTRQQVIVVTVIFLLLLALSLVVIHSSITRLLGRPMSRLSGEARKIVRGESIEHEEVREKSIFANLQRLLNSGRVLLSRDEVEPASGGGGGESPVSKREVNLVILVWAAVTTLLFLTGTVIMLVASLSLMNSKADAILTSVDREMADYYSSAYDSITGYAKSNVGVYVGGDIWNPGYAGNREESIERLTELLRYAFKCDVSVSYVEPGGEGRYFISGEPGVELKDKPQSMGEPIAIHRGYYRDGDLVMVLMDRTSYPGMGDGQFAYYVVDVTRQADVLEELYRSGSSSLLATQLWLSLLFLALCLVLSPLAMAWAVTRFITRPILELDAVSEKLIEGDLDVEISVDEKSSFADAQRLLERARELLRSLGEET